MPDQPRLHPQLHDPIESERCPDCGTPGIQIGRHTTFVVLACPRCEPHRINPGKEHG